MGIKRKAKDHHAAAEDGVRKKSKQAVDRHEKLQFPARPDWHAEELPALEQRHVASLPPQRAIDELHQYSKSLLETENATHSASHQSTSSSHKFLSTIMSNGTLEDKVSALTLLVQESPLHNTKALENLVGLSRKKGRNQALMALAAVKDLLGQGVVLPADRKLRAFGKQPGLLGALQGKGANWVQGQPLPGGLQDKHLLTWAYEDWLKRTYFEVLQILESWCGDEVEYSRSRAITYVWELLRDKPEQEENLLRLLVNKLGDTDRKIASRASHLLLQLETTHPAMKTIITNSIEADCLFRPGQSSHAKYYAIITLNQTVLSQKEQEVANKLLDVYFSLFVQLLKPTEENPARILKTNSNGKRQGGGGKAGKLAAKKRKAEERSEESAIQLTDRMIAQVLTGVNRAFPYADTTDPTFEKQIDTIFRVTHSANFNTAVQALILLQQISSSKHYSAERFYRTLYDSLLDPRLCNSSKQIMFLNLLYKSLKADLNAKRVQAFVKRLLQVITMHDPPFVCGVLYLVSELETAFPGIRSMMKEPEEDEDEEEHFVDAPEHDGEVESTANVKRVAATRTGYDSRKRDPAYANADRSCLWDLLPFLQHFHPSVSLFAESLLLNNSMPPKPDPTQQTLMHFLDRFVYRSARSKPSAGMHGASIMQPMAGSNAGDLLVKPGKDGRRAADLNAETFWQRKVEDVAADEVFFHSYFNQAGKKKIPPTPDKRRQDMDDASSDAGEEEIWKAITNSKPEVEGMDDGDDISMGDLESAYSADDDSSEAGIDLGGKEGDGGKGVLLDDGSEADEMDGTPELESEDDAMLDDEDELPEDFDDATKKIEPEEELSKSQKKRKERKKLRQLPTFASMEDYARLLGDDDDEDDM